jgi:predicted DNA-binding transcriptional regulator YafY
MTELESIARELEDAAGRLREQDLDPDEAADLVERCAELANRAGQELEREARATPGGEQPGQETLL